MLSPRNSSISTDTEVAAQPRSALLIAFPAAKWVVCNICTDPVAAELPEGAFLAALPTVIPVAKDIPAVFLAAVKEARPVVCRNPVTDVVGLGVAASPFLYGAKKEPAPGLEATSRLERVVEDIEFIFFIEFDGGNERRVRDQEERENVLGEEDRECEEHLGAS